MVMGRSHGSSSRSMRSVPSSFFIPQQSMIRCLRLLFLLVKMTWAVLDALDSLEDSSKCTVVSRDVLRMLESGRVDVLIVVVCSCLLTHALQKYRYYYQYSQNLPLLGGRAGAPWACSGQKTCNHPKYHHITSCNEFSLSIETLGASRSGAPNSCHNLWCLCGSTTAGARQITRHVGAATSSSILVLVSLSSSRSK